MTKTVLSLCDYSGNMVRPWAEAGYECICVDLKNGQTRLLTPGIMYIAADVREFQLPKRDYAAVFAFPPCTDLAVSGARWFQEKGMGRLIDALTVVEACRKLCESAGAPWLLENPVSVLSSYWRKPDYTFNPCDYGFYLSPPGDAYTKKTCLWTGGGFRMPAPMPVVPVEGSKMHLLPPSENRAEIRSETPKGFARAVFEENGRWSKTA